MSKWLDNAVFYEIYPQSFNDTNADGIGDFQGIIEKLDYIKELGCNAIWINPCFLSPFGDAGYDVADYCRVAPRYGTNEDLKRVFEEAHKRDMHVLLDLVPGHTSVEHPWFKESMKADRNEFTDRYVWTNNVWEAPEGTESGRNAAENGAAAPSQLRQWPVQIKLVQERASMFAGADLLVAADCTAYAYGNFHQDFIRNHVVLVGCTKLDDIDYSEKLARIFLRNEIKSITVARMEVPCCAGMERAVKMALKESGKKIPVKTVVISTEGEILQ